MPCISKIRLTNVVFENGGKRFNDDIFHFDGNNAAILLENGGGKTVLVQTALQAILPHSDLEERKIRNTLSLEGSPCHVAIEWILNERPRRYLITAVSLFITNNRLDSYKYTYEYDTGDNQAIDEMPFVIKGSEGKKRPASKGEVADYYQGMQARNMNAKLFKTIKEYHEYIEKNYSIIPSEWRSIALINSAEGGVENYFENCKTTNQLVNQLLIPVIEEAISESGKKDFANIFEEQRERFKKHKQLRERIRESQLIERKIVEYVQVFENYHGIDQDYLNKRQYAKAVHLYLEEEGGNLAAELQKNQKTAEDIQELLNELGQKQASYELAILDKELEGYLEAKQEAEGIFSEVKERFDQYNSKYHSLKLAKSKQNLKEVEESIANNQEQLKRLIEELNLSEIKEKLVENESELRGLFLKEEEALTQKLDELKLEMDNAQKKQDLEHKNLKELKNSRENQLSEYNQKRGQSAEIEKELKRLEKSIFGLDPNGDIRQQLQGWMERISFLEEASANNQTKISRLKEEQVSLEEARKMDQADLRSIETNRTLLTEKIAIINKEHERVLLNLKTLNNNWYHYDSLYKRERTILPHLTDKIDVFNREKEELLLKERRVGRYQDDYAEHKLFTAEPLLEQWISKWKDKFIAIESGTQYLQRAAKELRVNELEFLKLYPFWPLAIIVEDTEVQRLEEEIKALADQITCPIVLIGQQDAVSIITDKAGVAERMVLPQHWQENMTQELFEKWKEGIRKSVEELIKARREKEGEVQAYSQHLQDVNAFLNKYPYEGFIGLEKELELVQENLKELTQQISEKEAALAEIQLDRERYLEEISNYKDELNQLNQRVQTTRLYLAKQGEAKEVALVIVGINEAIEKLNRSIAITERYLASIKTSFENLEENHRSFQSKLRDLLKDPLYIEVQSAKPKFNDRSKAGLAEERNNLKELLNQQEGNYRYVEQAIQKDERRKLELIKEINLARMESSVPIDESIDYSLYGEEYLESALKALNKLKPEIKAKEDVSTKKKWQYRDHLAKVNSHQEQFFKRYDQRIYFEGSLEQVKESLIEEESILEKRKKENESSHQRLSKEEKDISSGIRILEIENGKYEYMLEEIQAALLEQDFYHSFPYRRLALIDEISTALKALKEARENAHQNLEEQKNNFIYFCEEEIRDTRLKERTVSGVRRKNSYQETMQWQSRMKKSIQHTIRVAEDDMREHDKDLEQFVNYLFTYLRTITNELSMIPKKTRIKVEDKWKEVYVFNVPEWTEEEGKEEIRKHIDWMLQELESYQFKNEDGSENSASIRKEVEKWLDVKQLLPLVLKNNAIKVSCRKVTNDNRISSGLTTWESSNRWSGGEKWSKNMTLFLGILNYVAERRQGIALGLKTNRTVIVDNPFGKASSDHVLDPVFYISEKLGFQIIALTAHSEGSFIRSYFPVVYSCKLREATNNKTMIIDKEKEIHHAFFRDNNPDSLYRLQEPEQPSLF